MLLIEGVLRHSPSPQPRVPSGCAGRGRMTQNALNQQHSRLQTLHSLALAIGVISLIGRKTAAGDFRAAILPSTALRQRNERNPNDRLAGRRGVAVGTRLGGQRPMGWRRLW